MIKTIILDDEKHSVATLTWKLEKFCPDIELVQSFTDSMEALEYIKENPPELLFLDVEMPRLNGFELLDELPKPHPFEVILITAYDDFGIRAVKADVLDYLLKPIQNQELKNAIEKLKAKKQDIISPPSPAESSAASTNKIALATKESIEYVRPEDILLCSSDSNYTMIYLAGGRKKLISKTLKDVESWLLPHGFYRAHNSHLVNLQHIKEYVRSDGGYLLLTDGSTLPVARNRKEELLGLL
ncbi:MAG: LytR/AlgR family response regulator transcription factor [Bacteroidia bacterium]